MSKRGRQEDQASVQHAIEVLCGCHPAKAETEGLSLTPLEQQVVALKESMPPHVILMVACGYRVKFYGWDSRAVSRRLGIMCIPGTPFEYSSVPYTRVDLYVHRLVAMGYQVGFADQESAAMRAADGLKSGLFTRTVSQLYSRATLLPTEHVHSNGSSSSSQPSRGGAADAAKAAAAEDEESGGVGEGETGDGVAEATGAYGAPTTAVDASELFLCFLDADSCHGSEATEALIKDGRTASVTRPPLRLLLVSFVTQRRLPFTVHSALELEDITQRYDMAEVVILTSRDPTADATAQGEAPNFRRSSVHFLRALPEAYASALRHGLPLHFGPTPNGEEDGKDVAVTGYVHRAAQTMDAAVEAYLRPFKLDKVYQLLCARSAGASPLAATVDVDTPDASPVMAPRQGTGSEEAPCALLHLPGPTLRALDIFHSSAGPRGSLLGLLDHSLTACGARCLRRWLAAPLCSLLSIDARQAVVRYLMKGSDEGQVEELLKECARLGDVEAVVGKLHAERCQVMEFVRLLRMVRGVAALAAQLCGETAAEKDDEEMVQMVDRAGGNSSPPFLLKRLLATVHSPAVQTLLTSHAALLRTTATTPLEFFSEGGRAIPESLQVHWDAKRAAEAALQAELQHARHTLGLPGLEYRTIAGTPFLLDVPQAKCSRVPADWVVQTRTKTNVRYHTPVIAEQQIALTAATERLTLAAASAWRAYQREVVSDTALMGVLSGVVEAIGSLDALQSLAVTSRLPGYTMPQLVDLPLATSPSTQDAAPKDQKARFVIRQGRHPVLGRLLPHGCVSCDATLQVGGAWLLTGPNMGGKSAFMRMLGTFSVLAQMGCAVPADAAVLPVFYGLYCRMGASDSILEGSSTFLSEMDETSRILRTPELPRSLVLMDELGRGTSSFDGAAVAAATLEYLLERHATTVFVTHYSYLCDPYVSERATGERDETTTEVEDKTGVRCYYMGFREAEAVPGDPASRQLVFTYKPCRGVTPSSFGVAVGRKAGLPLEVTQAARRLSAQVEEGHAARKDFFEVKRFVQSEGV